MWRRLRRLQWLLIAGSIIGPAAIFAVVAIDSRADVLDDVQKDVIRTTAILHELAQKVFETEELALDRVADRIKGQSWEQISDPSTSEFLRQLQQSLPQAVSIWISDAQGVMRAGSIPWNRADRVTDREFFTAQVARDAGTHVSAVFLSRTSHKLSFAVSRRRPTADGHFDGVLHLSLSPAYFTKFFAEAAAHQAHAASLLRDDGTILARDPELTGPMSLPLGGPMMQEVTRHPDGGSFTAVSPVDHTERIHAYQKVGSFPLYVVLGIDKAAALGAWFNNMLVYGLVAALASLALLTGSWLALRGIRAEETLVLQLRKALDDLEHETAQRQSAEEFLRQTQKMEAMGQLTGGIAHDFNNLLMAVLGNLELLRKRLADVDPRGTRLLDHAVQGAERGVALTRRLLSFGRRQTLRPEPVRIPSLVAGLMDLLRNSVSPDVAIVIRLPEHLPPVFVDANQLELALLNLAVNASDAMAGEGRLTISAREEAPAPGIPGETHVVICVADTGIGMDEATLIRAVEPFFTTKDVGRGTGLGLSMVHGLASQSGGRLVLHSQPGEGTVAELWLPRARTLPPEPAHRPGICPTAQRNCPTLSVLIVDDDPLVLTSTAAMLRDLGHRTIEASSGWQALTMIGSATVNVVITDHAMPGMTGVQLAAELRRIRPHLPVLLATGFVESEVVATSGLPVLVKPFDQATLAALLVERVRPAGIVCPGYDDSVASAASTPAPASQANPSERSDAANAVTASGA